MIAATILFLLARLGGVPSGTPSLYSPRTLARIAIMAGVLLAGFSPA